jgi:hypothetical protein
VSNYKRKTIDEWHIQGNYSPQYGYETVTIEESFKAAKVQVKCYRDNERNVSFRIKKIRVKIEEVVTNE